MDNMQETNSQEIDLIYLAKKIKQLFLTFCFLIVRFLKFLFKNKIIICLLIVIGAILGYYLDSKVKKEFKTEVVVIPNFESVDLLYAEVENFRTNLKANSQKNTYLKEVLYIDINPVENINSVLKEPENLEIFKVLSENGQDISKTLSNDQIKKSYKYHLIVIRTSSDKNTQKIIDFLLNTINHKSYYKNRSKIALENQRQSKLQYEKSIDQINKILENLGSGSLSGVGKDLNINNYDQLSNVIELKNFYTKELSKISMRLIEYQSAIYPIDISFNNRISQKLYQKNLIILPVIFITLFILFSYLKYFYLKYNRLYLSKQQNNA
ncbi:hypothetical protein OBJ95_02495 [Empedobacter falsenii]